MRLVPDPISLNGLKDVYILELRLNKWNIALPKAVFFFSRTDGQERKEGKTNQT